MLHMSFESTVEIVSMLLNNSTKISDFYIYKFLRTFITFKDEKNNGSTKYIDSHENMNLLIKVLVFIASHSEFLKCRRSVGITTRFVTNLNVLNMLREQTYAVKPGDMEAHFGQYNYYIN